MEKCGVFVDVNYTITGFLDGGDEECSSIQVNNEHTLSLESEAIGKGLHLNSAGLPVPKYVSVDQLLDLVKPANRKTAWKLRQGFQISAFRSDFMKYVEKRQRELYFAPQRRGILTARYAYCLKEELYNKKDFNWAEDRAAYMKKAIRRATARGEMDYDAKFNFASYLCATLSLRKGGSDHGKRRTRNTRNVTSTPKEQQSDTCDEEQFDTVLELTNATMNSKDGNRKRGKVTFHASSAPGGFQHARDETKDTVVNCLAAMGAAVKAMAEMSEWNRSMVQVECHRWKRLKRELYEEIALLRGETNVRQ